MNQKLRSSVLFTYCKIMTLLLGPVIFYGCYYDNAALLYPDSQPVDCSLVEAKFSAQVFPIIQTKCAISNCHDLTASGGFFFQSYNQVFNARERIDTRVIKQKTMPPTGPLDPAERNILECWIRGGAQNN